MTEKQRAAILRHGQQLLAIFPDAKFRGDPVELCRRLRRIECQANRYAERLCNEPVPEDEQKRLEGRFLDSVRGLLGDRVGRVWLNRDPRGYALKVDLLPEQLCPGCGACQADDRGWAKAPGPCDGSGKIPGEQLHRDWGGYGIIAPEIGRDGE